MLSELVHVNKYYMVHSFTKEYGISPINYLISRRIEESKYLLERHGPLAQPDLAHARLLLAELFLAELPPPGGHEPDGVPPELALQGRGLGKGRIALPFKPTVIKPTRSAWTGS